MTWTTPRTWISGETLTSALLNAQLRDNMLQQAAEIVTGERGYVVSNGLNSLAVRHTRRANVLATVTTTSTSYTSPSTSPGPTLTLDTDTQCVLMYEAHMKDSVGGNASYASVAVSGATTIAADDSWALRAQRIADESMCCAQFRWFNTLTPGENTFTMQYRVGGGTGTFKWRRLMALPL
jgi:hypothetical protein